MAVSVSVSMEPLLAPHLTEAFLFGNKILKPAAFLVERSEVLTLQYNRDFSLRCQNHASGCGAMLNHTLPLPPRTVAESSLGLPGFSLMESDSQQVSRSNTWSTMRVRKVFD